MSFAYSLRMSCCHMTVSNNHHFSTQWWQFGSDVNVVYHINKVNQHCAWLFLGWATISKQVNHWITSKLTSQVNSAWPSHHR